MKAFTLYSPEIMPIVKLLEKMKAYGEIHCDLNAFCKIYAEWSMKAFPGMPVDMVTATFRDDWFHDFLAFLANKEIDSEGEPVNE